VPFVPISIGLIRSSFFVGNSDTKATAINASGQIVVECVAYGSKSFRVAPDSWLGFDSVYLGALSQEFSDLGAGSTSATHINSLGQAVGSSDIGDNAPFYGSSHAFRTAPNNPINRGTDDLGTLGGSSSGANSINDFGQVVGWASLAGDTAFHAFLTATNSSLNAATDDLGTLGGTSSRATGINNYGQVVGWSDTSGDEAQHAFLHNNGFIHDINDLLPDGSGCEIINSADINNVGQIAANGTCNGQQHAVLLNPIFKAFAQQPINSDGSSVFSAKRGVVPVKFRLTQYGQPT
jgi:probable HAF family extracellular repeat protein